MTTSFLTIVVVLGTIIGSLLYGRRQARAKTVAEWAVGGRKLGFLIFWFLNAGEIYTTFAVLGIFSAFTLPYVLGPAAPEMMGPFMQRTFRDVNDPLNAMTQAVVTFLFCIVFGLFYVVSVARNREAGR